MSYAPACGAGRCGLFILFAARIVSRKFDSPDDQFRKFGHLAYGKGGWVLHMLRSQLGEELYRRCIKTYTERRQFANAVTPDLLAVIEEFPDGPSTGSSINGCITRIIRNWT
ncbi:MAG: M1 family metallopeptidase [Gammaproteobacteria bacterium]|nr:M1 family metallopeptidase [Gammaproteobacteria bacterium]